MSTNTKTPAPMPAHLSLDLDILRAITHRRLACRAGLSLPVAALVAALAWIGPDENRRPQR